MPESQSLVVRAVSPNAPGVFGAVVQAIEGAGGRVGNTSVASYNEKRMVRDYTVTAADPQRVVDAVAGVEGVTVDPEGRALDGHRGGVLDMRSRTSLTTRDDLAMAYTPGVARVCMAIHDDFDQAWDYTIKGNSVMVVTDGSRVMDLGDIGAEAALPAGEAKAFAMRSLAGIDAFPLPVDAKDVDEIVNTVALCSSVFAAVYLHDMAPDRMAAVKTGLESRLDIPVLTQEEAAKAGGGDDVAAAPGILRGLLDCRATKVTPAVLDAAAGVAGGSPLADGHAGAVADAVVGAATTEGLNRR
ncbi:MAG: hypothetical protein KDC33_02460 [Thermoleophilia bacterium]|nr:hypothetical protein [Thermoleophilia bacterium]